MADAGMVTKTVSMKTLARFFIVASVISFAVSLTGPGSEFLWGFLKPLSALLFGAFFISNLLAKEYDQYDDEHEYRMELARKQKGEPTIEDDAPATEPASSRPLVRERQSIGGGQSAESDERETVSLRDR